MVEFNECKLLDLINKTGYPLMQKNGQRKFGPPPDWTGPAPQKGCEVFVGKLPREIFEDELVPLFARIGRIYELRLMMDFSGSNRGYAFVTYTSRSDALSAVKQLNGFEIRPGRQIGVVKSVDNCRLYIGGIPKTKSKGEVFEELSKHAEGIVDVILYKNCFNRRFNRGFAFVEFVSHRAAAMARRLLVPGSTKLWDQDVSVDWAEPEPDVDDERMNQVKVLYVRNLLLETPAEKIQNIFEKTIGHKLERVKKIYDYAFLHFYERFHAELAMKMFHNAEIDGAQIEIRWAKPVDRELYKIQKLAKGNAKFNQGSDLAQTLLMYKQHLEKREYTLSSREDEGIGSGCAADSNCGSPTNLKIADLEISSPSQKLEAMCKRYGWMTPQYSYNSFYVPLGTECWVCMVELGHVGLPLYKTPNSVGPFFSRVFASKESAREDAADIALNYLKVLRSNVIQQSAVQACSTPLPPLYQPQTILPPMATIPSYGLTYDYLSPPLYPRTPVTLPIWRAA